MNKKTYQSPQMNVVMVRQDACICNGSTYENQFSVSNSEINLGQDDVWGGDLDW